MASRVFSLFSRPVCYQSYRLAISFQGVTSPGLSYNFSRTMSSEQEVALKKLGIDDPKAVTDEQWKSVLSPEAYEVTRQAGTEAPTSGEYDKFFEKGRYVCLCCGSELFNSDSKFWAGCGWPAFSKSVDEDMNIVRIKDNSYGRERVEVRCKPDFFFMAVWCTAMEKKSAELLRRHRLLLHGGMVYRHGEEVCGTAQKTPLGGIKWTRARIKHR